MIWPNSQGWRVGPSLSSKLAETSCPIGSRPCGNASLLMVQSSSTAASRLASASLAVTEALSLEQGREALRFANSFNRLPKLIDLAWSMGWADWMTLIGEEWESCDNIGQWLDELLEETPFADVLDDAALGKWLMNDDERVALAMLPGEVEIFRGCYEVNKWGLSWSLDRNVAAKFPTLPRYRQPGQPLLVRAAVKRENIIALKLGREEAEVVAYRPKHISTAHLQSISDDER